MSYVEPTSAALLALDHSEARLRGRGFLLSLQRPDGGWGIAAMDVDSGWMTAWAVRALADLASDAVGKGVRWLQATEGIRLLDDVSRSQVNALFQIDSTLRGWPWQPGDSAWVHPTALAIVGLVAAGYRDSPRVRDGVAFLFDRAVPEGGWNVGNPMMLGKQIPATIQDTAVALIALRAANVEADVTGVSRALDFLRSATDKARTPAELAWGSFGLQQWNVDVGDALQRLNSLQNSDGSWNRNPFITAIAQLALDLMP